MGNRLARGLVGCGHWLDMLGADARKVNKELELVPSLIGVTGLRIGEVLAFKWKYVEWGKFRIRVICNFVRGKFGEPKSAASKKPVVLHTLVMDLLRDWRETTIRRVGRLWRRHSTWRAHASHSSDPKPKN